MGGTACVEEGWLDASTKGSERSGSHITASDWMRVELGWVGLMRRVVELNKRRQGEDGVAAGAGVDKG